ncbi:hypothetical protein GF351_06410, partial [Candidatus Woesearchaeota archaeon]|nr:hypothetical protein [Candidatus Woesearchaeota archaeon]
MNTPVFIAAGYGEDSIPIDKDEPCKSFVKIHGKPLFGYSLEAALGFTEGEVYIWGDKDRLEEETRSGTVEIPSDDDLERIVFVEQEENMFDSFLKSFFRYLADVRGPDDERMFENFEGDPGNPGQVSGYIRRNPLATMHAAMVLPCDTPLITVREIISFYRKALRLWDKADSFGGMSRKQDLESFMEHAGVDFTEQDYRNLNMNFMPMLGGDYRINNMWIMKPMRVLERCPEILELLPEIYAKRYQSKAENIKYMISLVRKWQSDRGTDQAEKESRRKALIYDMAVWLPPIVSQMLNKWQKDSRRTVWYSPRIMDHAFTEDFWPARLVTTRYPSS